MIDKASEIFFGIECEASQFSVFQDVSRNCCTTQNIELIVDHIPHSDDAHTSFSFLFLIFINILTTLVSILGEFCRIKVAIVIQARAKRCNLFHGSECGYLWLNMTWSINLCIFVKTIRHGESEAFFCLLGLWSIRKNRKSNPPNQIRHHNKREPGGLLDFSILYSVFCPTTRNDLRIIYYI